MATQRITAAFVRTLNQQVTGTAGLVVKPNELQSALSRPLWKQTYAPDATPAQLAASLAFGIFQNHPFMDGNKRTAFWTANEYLKDIRGTGFIAGMPHNTSSEWAMQVIHSAHADVATGAMDEAGLSEVYEQALKR
ncbi:hypothetical protein BD410DRAFT_709152 [Rickenella mellea]|uniref:Fido domain-containing protein n=1 Tax=Rickenella mellea TaxID=50990 RepID=A0A4R5XHS2_9AGAM|nr:hypothetical protein BD410DRAFT_709152 [Rickenella mellea]